MRRLHNFLTSGMNHLFSSPFRKGGCRGIFQAIIKSPRPPLKKGVSKSFFRANVDYRRTQESGLKSIFCIPGADRAFRIRVPHIFLKKLMYLLEQNT
ncbi:MAG: hypothetical protein C0407_18790 [Desulfobacca sp.]|nr:hypothetical protein [Desulfobacca sp.]